MRSTAWEIFLIRPALHAQIDGETKCKVGIPALRKWNSTPKLKSGASTPKYTSGRPSPVRFWISSLRSFKIAGSCLIAST